MTYLANAFALSMLGKDLGLGVTLTVTPVSTETVRSQLAGGFTSVVGHKSTADLLAARLGVAVQENRVNLTLGPRDVLLVAQVEGRLAEGKVLTAEELGAVPMSFRRVTLT